MSIPVEIEKLADRGADYLLTAWADGPAATSGCGHDCAPVS